MKSILTFMFLITYSLSSVQLIKNCLFGNTHTFLDLNVMEAGFFSNSIIDGYVTRVLKKIPNKIKGQFDLNEKGIDWDYEDDPNPMRVYLVIQKGLSPRSGRKINNCQVTHNFSTIIIQVEHFNQSDTACATELYNIQNSNPKRRILASYCGPNFVFRGTRIYKWNFSTNKNNFFYTYTQEEEIFADFHHDVILRMRTTNGRDNENKCKDPAWNKCQYWNSGGAFSKMSFGQWFGLSGCFTDDQRLCAVLQFEDPAPFSFPPYFLPGEGTGVSTADCCRIRTEDQV